MLLTLFLTENTPIALAGVFLLAPLVLILIFPIFLLSRPESSEKAKLIAFGLALLPIWFGNGISDELGWWVNLLIYLPLGVALLNLARSVPKP